MNNFFLKYILLVFVAVFVINTAQAQDRKTLERKKIAAQKEIDLTKKILLQTGKQKTDNLHALMAIKNLIKAREKLIYTLSQQVDEVANELEIQKEELIVLESRLEAEKGNYAKLIVNTYKTRGTYNEVAFIFSSTGFFNALTRLKYLKMFSNEQDRLVHSIEEKKVQIHDAIVRLEKLKIELESLLGQRVQERDKLEGDKVQKDEMVKSLSNREKELNEKLKKQQAAYNELDRQIKIAIQREIEEARKKREAENKKKGKTEENKSNVNILTPEAQALSNEFAGNRLKLPWPTETGFITQKFGNNAHPTLAGIYIENNGVDIATQKGTKARAVFKGEVVTIFQVPGMGKAILINHGEYYSVYARLDEIFVKQGQKVNTKESLGIIFTDDSGKTELHFEIWKNTDKLNPEQWLMKR
ncbi:MAG: peptidoglycan DD-metalloendopeptidase family protein [Bacteroidia bacterium]|nr:peptidoglycan DD-metalloendopeptidase family protein [Bacteroidia bacterium]